MTNAIFYPRPPRIDDGTFTNKNQSPPEVKLRQGPELVLGMGTQIWSTQPELVSVTEDPSDDSNMLVALNDAAFVDINLQRNQIDPKNFLRNLHLKRMNGRVYATAIVEGQDFGPVAKRGDTRWYLADRHEEISDYLSETYDAEDDGSGRWKDMPLAVGTDVTDCADVDGNWMTVNTADVFDRLWSRQGRLGKLRDDIESNRFLGGVRKHLDRQHTAA